MIRRVGTLCHVFLASLAFFACVLTTAFAEESIRSFESQVEIAKDGTFTVTETITVKAEGRQIKRGIFRDFPLIQENDDGKQVKVGFNLISVARDGRPDQSRVVDNGSSVRIYIGRESVFLDRGEYTYTIKYETTRQMRFFETHDEVYWNATGNFWKFPIEKATAKIVLPEGANVEETLVYTGRVGASEQAASISTASGNRVVRYTSNRVLAAGEGMTVLAKLTKGSIETPSEAQLSRWFWKDNLNVILASIILALISIYYFTAWWSVGRDPAKGIVVPRWDAPDDMSPALINYIHRKGLAGKGFDAISAAVLNLAVKGFVTLDKKQGDLHIKANSSDRNSGLPIGEQAILNSVLSRPNDDLIVSTKYGSSIKLLQSSFASAIEGEHRDKFYKHNTLWVIFGVFLSLIGLGMVIIVGDFSEEALGLLLVSGVATIFISAFVLGFVKNVMNSRSLVRKIFSMIVAGFLTFSLLSSFFTIIVGSLLKANPQSLFMMIVVGIIVLNILFYFLLGAPTALGRKRMDEIEGLKTYLELAEKDRMNLAGAPDFSTQHYEELLPYAVALGVEKPWSKAFEGWLAAAVAAGAVAASYSPNWYRGSDFRRGGLSDTMDDFTNSMQSGFASSMPVPKSSSSGFSSGGGFSGGGGGGGGGGGW